MPDGHDSTDEALPVDGSLPAALSGRYVCLETNPSGGPRVHSVVLDAGTAGSYRRRLILTRAPTGGAATNLVDFAGHVVALADGAIAQELSTNLAGRPVDVAGLQLGVGAYPKRDPRTGELHVISSPGETTTLHHVISGGGMTRRTHPIGDAPAPVLDLAITRDHLVLIADGYLGVTDLSRNGPVAWLMSRPTRPGCVAGAHDDDDGTVVVHVVGEGLERWTATPSASEVDRRILDGSAQQPSRRNEHATGPADRYLYGVSCDAGTAGATTLYKHDLVANCREDRAFGAGRQAGEFLFVVDPTRQSEEDGGWLLGLVHDVARERTSFVVLDAADVTGPILGSARLPGPVPRSFRGLWSPGLPSTASARRPSSSDMR